MTHRLLPLALALLPLPALAQDISAQDPAAPEAPSFLAATPDLTSIGAAITAEALANPLSEDIGRGLDATMAQYITATGAFTGFSPDAWAPIQSTSRPIVANAYSQRNGAMFADPGLQWSQLGKQEFGSPDRLTIGVEQKFADARTMATQIRLRHTAGPVDVRVNVKGATPLATANPMQLSYDSSALYRVTSGLELGVVARGSLGSIDDIRITESQHNASALARFKLTGKDRSLSAETSYDKRLGPGAENQPGQFRMNLNFNWKL